MKLPNMLETARLYLRTPVIEDASSIFSEYAQDHLVTKFLEWKPHKAISETRDFLNRCLWAWSEGIVFPWVVIDRESQRLMGMIEARVDGHRVELGYVLGRAFWGKGYMPEAADSVIWLALKQQAIYRVWAVCDTENTASQRVLEKVGLQNEGILRRWSIFPNISAKPRDCYCYAAVK